MDTRNTFKTVFAAVLAAAVTVYVTSLWLPAVALAAYQEATTISGFLKVGGYTELTNKVGSLAEEVVRVTGASGQTGDLVSVLTSSTEVFQIDNDGDMTQKQSMMVDGAADEVQLTVQGYSSQTADLFVCENSAGTNLFEVEDNGKVIQTTDNSSTSTFVSSALTRLTSVAQHYIWRFDDASSTSTSTTGKFTCDLAGSTDCDGIKNFGAYFVGQIPSGATGAFTGDSRAAVVKISGSNFGDSVVSDNTMKLRGVEINVANRAGGDILEVAGIDLVVQGIDGSNTSEADYIIGMRTALESSIDQGSPVEMAGYIAELKTSVAKPTNQYAFVADNQGSYADSADSAYFVRDSGTNTGFRFGLDMGSASISSAAIRMNSNVCHLAGAGRPADATTGDNICAKGSLYTQTDASSDEGMLWTNVGTVTDPVWEPTCHHR